MSLLTLSCRSSYVPPRAAWGANDARTLSPHPAPSPLHATTGQGSDYYEDVDPRFARRPSPQNDQPHPLALTPGGGHCMFQSLSNDGIIDSNFFIV